MSDESPDELAYRLASEHVLDMAGSEIQQLIAWSDPLQARLDDYLQALTRWETEKAASIWSELRESCVQHLATTEGHRLIREHEERFAAQVQQDRDFDRYIERSMA